MIKQEILKDTHFEELIEARMDSKHRVTLGRSAQGRITSFRVYRNAHGQFILDPLVSIPAHEAWLFKNKRAAELVRSGLEDARQGRLVKTKENFAQQIKHKD